MKLGERSPSWFFLPDGACKGFLCQKNPTYHPWSEFVHLGTSPRGAKPSLGPVEAADFEGTFEILGFISWRWLSESWGYGYWVRTPKTDLERHKWYTSMIIYAPPKKIKDQWAWNLIIIFAWLWCRNPECLRCFVPLTKTAQLTALQLFW